MAMAAKSFGRRPREEPVADNPAASLGAVLELMRALNWFIRADVPWPTKRGQIFDFVLAGESGVFAMWVHDGEPVGVEDAAAELGRLLGDVLVRPVVCRSTSSLAHAGSSVLFCTPETAIDLLVGLPAYEYAAEIPAIVNRLRDLVVPNPPEPEPRPEPKPAPEPVPAVVTPAKVEPPIVPAKPTPVAPAARAVTPPVPAAEPPPVAPQPVEPSLPDVEPSLPDVEPSLPDVEKSDDSPTSTQRPKAERLPGGRHRFEKPRKVKRTPPAPPVQAGPPKSSLELPTALAPKQPRRTGGNEAAQRFDNNYVYVAPQVERPGALKREFRFKPFLFGVVGLIVLALAVGVGIKEWPKIAGLAHSNSNVSAAFGQPISVSTTNYHPDLTLTVTAPTPVSVEHGSVLYAVTLTATNTGSGAWQLPAKSALTMTDSIGESSPVSDFRGSRWGGSLKAKATWTGKLIFKIRTGRTPASVQFALAASGDENATWR